VTCVSVSSKVSKATSDIMPYILQKHTILRGDNGGRKISRNVGTFPTGVITHKIAILNLRFFFRFLRKAAAKIDYIILR